MIVKPVHELRAEHAEGVPVGALRLEPLRRLCFQHLCLPFRPLPYLTWPITCRNKAALHEPILPRLRPILLPFQKQSPAKDTRCLRFADRKPKS